MHSGTVLAQAVRACRAHAGALTGILYRAVHLSWFDPFAAAAPLFTRSSVRSRFLSATAAGAPEALYAALEADTAFREFNQDFLQAATTAFGAAAIAANVLRPYPCALYAVRFDLSRVLDVRTAPVQTALGTNPVQLAAPWKNLPNPTPTQQLGEAVFTDNWFEGLLYDSVQHPGNGCLVVFKQRLSAKPAVDFRGYTAGRAPKVSSVLADARLP